jgi:hypothetical protein
MTADEREPEMFCCSAQGLKIITKIVKKKKLGQKSYLENN